MTEEETVDLLAFMTAYDRRTVGMSDVAVWSRNQTVRRLTLEQGKDVVVAFHDQDPDPSGQDRYLTPQQFNRWAKIVADRQARARRAAEEANRLLTKGRPDPKPANFADMVRRAAEDFANRSKV